MKRMTSGSAVISAYGAASSSRHPRMVRRSVVSVGTIG